MHIAIWFHKTQKNQYKKKEHNFEQLSYQLNVTDPFLIPMIFIFLSCPENAHDNKEFSCEIPKSHHESQITTR